MNTNKCLECNETKGLRQAWCYDDVDPTTGQMPIVFFCKKHFEEMVEQ